MYICMYVTHNLQMLVLRTWGCADSLEAWLDAELKLCVEVRSIKVAPPRP
jgi:hypothetical protein